MPSSSPAPIALLHAMFLARRSAAPARNLLRNQQPRRFDSHAAHHAQPVSEGLGRSFYVTIGSFALSYGLYRYHQSYEESGSGTWMSRLITNWTPSEKVFEQRNAIHTVAMEKAARDRHLFQSQGPAEAVELNHPEVLNSGGPYNVPAGSVVDLSAVAAHYDRQNKLAEEARVARMKDGKVVSLYD